MQPRLKKKKSLILPVAIILKACVGIYVFMNPALFFFSFSVSKCLLKMPIYLNVNVIMAGDDFYSLDFSTMYF